MKFDSKEVKSIEILDKEKISENASKILGKIHFSEELLNFVENTKWIKIINKKLYFNKQIMACYPDYTDPEIDELCYDVLPSYEESLERIENNKSYEMEGIKWDIQTKGESINSFHNKNHPMETSEKNYSIHNKCMFLYKMDKYVFIYCNEGGNISGKVSPVSFDPKIDRTNLLLIPIFRLGKQEDYVNFEKKDKIFEYPAKTVLLLLMLHNMIPELPEELKEEYTGIYSTISGYLEYIENIEIDKKYNLKLKINVNDEDLEIDSEKIKNIAKISKIEIYLENEDKIEISDFEEVVHAKYLYQNGDVETLSYITSDGDSYIRSGEALVTKSNGDKETKVYIDGIAQGTSEYNFENGDKEIRNYVDGVLQGKSEYIYVNGEREIRNYIDGKLQGEGVFYSAEGEATKVYWYEDKEKRDITAMRKILDVDKIRINISAYDENILTDPNRGHWDLFEKDLSEIEEGTGKSVYGRDPRKDIKRGGIVGIDFGTKSTVVVFQDNNRTIPMRISGGNLYLDVDDKDYENPTVIEFRNITRFMKDYKEKEGRPLTKWEDVTVSYIAFNNLLNGTSKDFSSTLSSLKQWAGSQNDTIVVRDKNGVETLFPPYLELKDENVDPIELYAYYIGSYINNMRNGIYLEYFLSFPVTYEKKIREKILQSFERGIKKSLPESILSDEDTMKKFKVRHGANEPAAYAVCALQEYEFEPEDDEKIYYGVFDFGGGTADFDFGIWKAAEDERSFDYELTHFGAGGDRYLGGENILKELAYTVLKDEKNLKELKNEKISFARPEWCERFPGDEIVVDNSPEAKLNIRMVMEKIRPIWERTTEEESKEGKIKVSLYTKDGILKAGIPIDISIDELENVIESKIERGIKNFFIALNKALKDEGVDKINIFLAGNSCKHPKVMELFEKHREDFNGEIEIFPALGTNEAYEKMKERNIEVNREDKTNPTGKTGVAYGIIDSRAGGRIDIKNRDEESNIDNEINFKYYVGYEGRKKLKVVLGPQTQYEQFVYYINVTADVFDLYYSSLPEAMESKMPIDKAIRKRIELNGDYEGAKIYIKAVTPDTLKYVVTQKDIEEKEYLEEGEIKLD